MKKIIALISLMVLFSTLVFAADPVSMTKRTGIVSGYEYTETIADGATGRNVAIPPMRFSGSGITITLIAGANTGKFQLSTSPDANIIADTATWTDWTETTDTGSISMTVGSQVTGIRGASKSGEIKIEIVY